ncbi:MAG: Fe-S cluster assembly protein SufB, partial [Candidatus Nitrosothermus koennekii]
MMTEEIVRDYSKYDFKDPIEMYTYLSKKGLSRETVEEISRIKNEPEWMREFRLKAYDIFIKTPMPTWGGDLSKVDFDNVYYYAKAVDKQGKSWDELPENIRRTFERLGIPEAERKFLAGVGAQYESETVYHSIREDLAKKGVIFMDTDSALKEHEDIFKKHFATVVPPNDNKFAALNSAVWSGGSFVYIPKGVEVDMPLNAYFRINAQNMGQFERTLIIAEEGSKVHYIEGCTAPVYSTESLHCAVVEVIAKKGATVRYTTLQNWSNDVYNLVTKRAHAYENAVVEWVDANIGSKLTMKYPSVYLLGRGAKADLLSVAFAGKGQHQDTGAKAVHIAPDTTSRIISKSVSKDDGRTSYRGLLYVAKGARNVKSTVRCDALLIDDHSRTDTYPYIEVNED